MGPSKSATVEFDGIDFKETVACTADTAHAYTFYPGGIAVGNEVIGEVEVDFEGEIIKQGTEFMGEWHSANDE